jgi:RHS repeat-associated protein
VYEAYGKALVNVQEIENNFRFPGQYYDSETGLHYNFFRYYDTETGRYISVDPARDGINFYAYCKGNPLNFVDPYGLCPTLTVYVIKGQPAGQRDSLGGWGHTWVELKDIYGDTISIGSYPAGVVNEPHKPSEADISITYDISEEQYENAKIYIDEYKKKKIKWRTYTENCTDFVYKVAETGAGVDLPGSDWGIDYPDNLAEDLINLKKQLEKSGIKIEIKKK